MKIVFIIVATASFLILLDFIFILKPEKILPLSEFRGFWIIFSLLSISILAFSLPKLAKLVSRETSYYENGSEVQEVELE